MTADARLLHLRGMIRGRVLDERLAALYRQGQIRGGSVFVGRGQEAFSVAGTLALRPWKPGVDGDFYAPLIRDTAGRLAFGETALDAFMTYLGRARGPMRARDGNIHRGKLECGMFPMISHLGASISVVAGALLAQRLAGTLGDRVGLANIGDGGMQTGALHEGLNLAAVERLPLVLLVADNQVSYSTFSDRTYACRDLVDRAAGYGIAGHSCDGTDFDACRLTVGRAVAAARAGGGPQMVVARLLRLAGHGEHDDGSYVPADLRARFGDCVLLADAALRAEGVDTAPLWEEARAEVALAVAEAQAEAEPDPADEVWSSRSLADLTRFTPALPPPSGVVPATYLEALREAQGDALAGDPRVFLYGQDIGGTFGGAFKATKGLVERFPDRVRNSPISEDAMAGVAVGSALYGGRPVIEFQFADFASVAFSQIVNHLATYYWRTGRPVPAVLRFPAGGTPGGGPFHCQMPEGWLSHHPGLVLVAPSTVEDAYHQVRQAVACDDPVLVIEHKHLYHHLKAEGDVRALAPLPLGAAAVRRSGRDITLISYSAMVHTCLGAAEVLQRDHGIEAEVLDLRCLRPLDSKAIIASVARTNRVLMVTEAWPFGGIAAEVLALVSSEAFQHLDAPPRRLCAEDTPVPYHPDLFHAHRPDVARVVAGVLDLVEF